jgi:Fe2+ transport system protein FeoA
MNAPRKQPIPIPLCKATRGQTVRFVGVEGGCGLQRRLLEMGFRPGTLLEIIEAGRGGPVIVQLAGSRLVLGRGMIDRVLVTPVPTPNPNPNAV